MVAGTKLDQARSSSTKLDQASAGGCLSELVFRRLPADALCRERKETVQKAVDRKGCLGVA